MLSKLGMVPEECWMPLFVGRVERDRDEPNLENDGIELLHLTRFSCYDLTGQFGRKFCMEIWVAAMRFRMWFLGKSGPYLLRSKGSYRPALAATAKW